MLVIGASFAQFTYETQTIDNCLPSDFRADGHLNATIVAARHRSRGNEKYVQTYV